MNIRSAGFGIVEIIIGLVVVGMIAAGGWVIWTKVQKANAPVTSYAECAAAGNPIIETYPEQCVANGETFVNPDAKSVKPATKSKTVR